MSWNPRERIKQVANDFAIIETMKQVEQQGNLNMKHWATKDSDGCGTTLCLGGHAVTAFGHSLVWEPEHRLELNPTSGYLEATQDVTGYKAIKTTDGKWVEDLAQEILGLDDDEANRIFYAVEIETIDELWDLITEVTGVERPA